MRRRFFRPNESGNDNGYRRHCTISPSIPLTKFVTGWTKSVFFCQLLTAAELAHQILIDL
jgi:hypothetical protein